MSPIYHHPLIPRTVYSPSLSSEVFLSLFAILSVFCFWLTPGGLAWALYKTRHQVRIQTAIPGPSGVPVLVLVLAFSVSLTHRVLANLAQTLKAKTLMALSLGFSRFIISSEPETAKELLNSSAFVDRPIKESAYKRLFHRAALKSTFSKD